MFSQITQFCFNAWTNVPTLLENFHIEIHVSQQWFSNLTSDWLAAQPPANQKPCLKSLLTDMEFNKDFT